MRFQKIGIVGLGLIGGSLALKLKEKGYTVYTALSKSPDLKKAKKIIDHVFPSIEELANASDLLILATPLSTITSIAKSIRSDHPLLVIDVGSVKEKIVREFEKLTKGNLEFLSTHPMSGSEKQGFGAARADLFEKAPWIVIPHKKNKAKINSFIRIFNSKPIQMSASEHDKKIALISHLPALISEKLLEFVTKKDPKAIQVAGPGFKSMTRLAKGNLQLRNEIKSFNHKHLSKLLKEWSRFISG